MNVVNERNFDDIVTQSMRDEYWARVGRAMSEIFNSDPDRAHEYRRVVEAGAGLQRMLAYHDDPLQVAADLAGQVVTSDQVEQYERMFPDEIEPAQPVSTLP